MALQRRGAVDGGFQTACHLLGDVSKHASRPLMPIAQSRQSHNCSPLNHSNDSESKVQINIP
eukprot:scaffold26989_cov40-Prasinocladus_malaysianus.AAC.1